MSFSTIIPTRIFRLMMLEEKLTEGGVEVTDDMRPLDEYEDLERLFREAGLDETETEAWRFKV